VRLLTQRSQWTRQWFDSVGFTSSESHGTVGWIYHSRTDNTSLGWVGATQVIVVDPDTNTTTASLPLEQFRPDTIRLGAEGTPAKLSRALASVAGRVGAPSEASMLSTTELPVYDEAMLTMLQTLAALEAQGVAAAAAAAVVQGEGTNALSAPNAGENVDKTASALESPTFAALYDDATAAMHLALERCEQQGGGGGGGTGGGAGGSGGGSGGGGGGGGGGGSARDALSRLGSAARTTTTAPCGASDVSVSSAQRGADETGGISAAMVEDNASALTRVTPVVEAAPFADPVARQIALALPSRHRAQEAAAAATAVLTGGPAVGDVTTYAASRWVATAAGAALLEHDGSADAEGEAEAAEAAGGAEGWTARFTRWQAELREQRMEYEAASRSSWKFHARKEMMVPIVQTGGGATVREYLKNSDRLVRMMYSDEQVHQVRVELNLLP
jgi:hypothetical protein